MANHGVRTFDMCQFYFTKHIGIALGRYLSLQFLNPGGKPRCTNSLEELVSLIQHGFCSSCGTLVANHGVQALVMSHG